MAKLILEGREIVIVPYKLGGLRRAAPFIQKVFDLGRTVDLDQIEESLDVMARVTREVIEVIAIGAAKVDPALTADAIEDLVSMDDVAHLQEVFQDFLREAGLKSGEVPAPTPEAVAEPHP